MFTFKSIKTMSEITMSQVTELNDPKLQKIALRIVREAELAIEKVAANHKQAAKFPVSISKASFEGILKTRFAKLPQVKKDNASAKAQSAINLPAATRKKRLGDLSGIDLSVETAVDVQAKSIALPASLKFSATEIASIFPAGTLALPISTGIAAPVTNKLELRIHKVRCVDETGGWLAEHGNDDEIDLGGTTVDETGDTKKVTKFRVGSSFDDGEEKSYSPPRRFTFFNLTEGTAFPKYYYVTLVLAESDMGDLPDFLSTLLDLIKQKVKEKLIEAGAQVDTSIPAIGAIIGAAIGYIVDRVFDYLRMIWEDEVFQPITVFVKIPSLTTRWPVGRTDSPEQTVVFKGHGGEYRLTYDWRLYA